MKVSEAIDQLAVGDTVWVKGEVERIDEYSGSPLDVRFLYECRWFSEDDEISLTEPTKKVEIPLYVGSWIVYCKNKNYSLHTAMNRYRDVPDVIADIYQDFRDWLTCEEFQENEEIFARAWLGEFTVKPKKWVVKNEKGYVAMENFKDFDNHKIGVKFTIVSEKSEAAYWDNIDKSKAEAVATLVEGSVEEV